MYTLRITNDNEMLVAISKEGEISTLELEENLYAVRINFPKEVYGNVDIRISNDNNFIFIKLTND